MVRILCAAFALLLATVAADAEPAPMTLAAAKAAPPGTEATVTGIVLSFYLCPPCPAGTYCKPCFGPSSVTIAEKTGGDPTLRIAVDEPAAFAIGARYRFTIKIATPGRDGVEAFALGSTRLDGR